MLLFASRMNGHRVQQWQKLVSQSITDIILFGQQVGKTTNPNAFRLAFSMAKGLRKASGDV